MTDAKTYLRWLTKQVGVEEKPRGSNLQPYAALAGHPNGYAWCATYQVAGAKATGLRLPDGANTASCALNEVAYKGAGRLSTKPRVGSVFFVYFPNLKPYPRVAHTGVVWKVDGNRIHTVEGNSNDVGAREGWEVCLRTRPAHRAVGAVGVRSYGMPYYEENDMGKLEPEDITALVNQTAERVLRTPLIPLTEAAAKAIGGGHKEGEMASLAYLVQWPPLVREANRAELARDTADAARDARLQKAADDLAVSVAQLGRTAGTGGVDLAGLVQHLVPVLAPAVAQLITPAILDGLAARLKS